MDYIPIIINSLLANSPAIVGGFLAVSVSIVLLAGAALREAYMIINL